MSLKYFSLMVCIGYGLMSFTQTLNSKYLYRQLKFNFYSFSFAAQRIIIVIVLSLVGVSKINWDCIKAVAPFSLMMCLINLLSSFCITVMPLGAFAAFKKIVIIFVFGVGLLIKSKRILSNSQYICMCSIGIGALFVGAPDIGGGQYIGYLSCIAYNITEAVSLQYSSYLSRQKKFEPLDLLFYNAFISFPYYSFLIFMQNQSSGIISYFNEVPTHFYPSFILMLALGCFAELSVNYITMKISPFEKATISNIKDVLILIVSVEYLNDFILYPCVILGLLLIFVGSILFSIPYFQDQSHSHKKQILPQKETLFGVQPQQGSLKKIKSKGDETDVDEN